MSISRRMPIRRCSFSVMAMVLLLMGGVGFAVFTLVNAQTDASVTPLTPAYGGPNYDQPLWIIRFDSAVIPVSFTYYHCTSAALVLEYATWADYTKLDWQTGKTSQYTGFIPASAPDLSQKVNITIPNLSPSTSYIFRVGAMCTSSSPQGSLVYTASTNQFTTPAVPPPWAGRAEFQYGDAGGSIENTVLLTQKVINLTNAGSVADVFRTTLPVNPETRCGLRSANSTYPANVLPNSLPATLDTPLASGEATYISVACVTSGLAPGPFTWGFKTISVGALESGRTGIAPLPLITEVYDTVNITAPIPCSDSDGGTNAGTKGIATGTYAGARAEYIAIYGQEPYPLTPKSTTEKYSTYIDHCATVTQLNEGFCGADGRLSAIGISCPNGCRDGVCIASIVSSVSSAPLFSSSFFSSFSSSSIFPASIVSSIPSPLSGRSSSAGQIHEPSGLPMGSVLPAAPPSAASPALSLPSPFVSPGSQSAVAPSLHPASLSAPSEAQAKFPTVSKEVRKAPVRVLQKQQQALRRELRRLERSLLRKKNVVALGQIADLRDELADLDLYDPSTVTTLRELQQEVVDLRRAILEKTTKK